MQAELFRAGFRAYLEYRRKGCHEAAQLPLLIVAFALLTLVGCVGEDNLEKPYYAIPYYTFWGFVLRIVYQMRVEARSGRVRSEERRVGKECVSTCRSRGSPSH